MILPQLEQGYHGSMWWACSSSTTTLICCDRETRLAKAAKEQGILLMMCDQCAVRRNLADGTFEQCGRGEVTPKGTVEGVSGGCFPQFYEALSGNPPDQVITL
jgi:hypothetical protein